MRGKTRGHLFIILVDPNLPHVSGLCYEYQYATVSSSACLLVLVAGSYQYIIFYRIRSRHPSSFYDFTPPRLEGQHLFMFS